MNYRRSSRETSTSPRHFLLFDLFDVDHARKVLIRFGHPSQVDYLLQRLLVAETCQVPLLVSRKGSGRVSRGGGRDVVAERCRSASGNSIHPTVRGTNCCFRMVVSLSSQEQLAAEPEQDGRAEPSGKGTQGASTAQRP